VEQIDQEIRNSGKRSRVQVIEDALHFYFENLNQDRFEKLEQEVSELASDIHTLQRELAVLRSAVSDIVLKFEQHSAAAANAEVKNMY